MKWPRHTVFLVVGVMVFLVVMNILGSDRVPEACHFRNWPDWAHMVFGLFAVCFVLYALWTDIRDIRDAWRSAKDESDHDA